MPHLFLGFGDGFKRRFVPMLIATLVTMAAITFIDAQYRTPAAPHGIVSLQLASKPLQIQWILEQWSARVGMTAWVAFGLGVDYLFIALYSVTLAMACVRLGEKLGVRAAGARSIAIVLGYGALLAGLFDAVENAADFAMLVRAPIERWMMIGFVCAILKFALLGAVFAFCIAGALAVRFAPRDA